MPTTPTNGHYNEVGNNVHADLTLTRYPEALDTRGDNDTGGNENLNIHKNLEDYNMAEHVNALADAVMSIQRALGIAPQLRTDEISTGDALYNKLRTLTVKSRLDTLEDKNFDARYGGTGWSPTSGQTLVGHTHTGAAGHPQKIQLTSEVQGLLPKANMNLVYNSSTGLTGANIALNSSSPDTIDSTVADKLSVTQGGTIKNDLTVTGKSWTRWGKDYDASDMTGDVVSDGSTSTGSYVEKTTDTYHKFIQTKFGDLYHGRYVAIVRAKTNTKPDANLLKISAVNASGTTTGYDVFKGTDFYNTDSWQNFYFIFDHNQLTGKNGGIKVEKYATTLPTKVSIDYVVVTPVHPAIFDR